MDSVPTLFHNPNEFERLVGKDERYLMGGQGVRLDSRVCEQIRSVEMERGYVTAAEGSVYIRLGKTRVLTTVTVEERVPLFLRNAGRGWVTAEYAMLPRATRVRTTREATRGKQGGRTMEIQRLIGRSLRAVIDRKALGERTLWVDCDVIQADGGTRTAAITGAFVAIVDALVPMVRNKVLRTLPILDFLAAISVGMVHRKLYLDLCYEEDSAAAVDMNVIMTGSGQFVEIQGTGEETPFTGEQLQSMLQLAKQGIRELIHIQKEVLGEDAEYIGKL